MTKLFIIPTIAKATSQFLGGKESTLCPQILRILCVDWENRDFAALCTVLCSMCECDAFPISEIVTVLWPYRSRYFILWISEKMSLFLSWEVLSWVKHSGLQTWTVTHEIHEYLHIHYMCTHIHPLLILLKYKIKKERSKSFEIMLKFWLQMHPKKTTSQMLCHIPVTLQSLRQAPSKFETRLRYTGMEDCIFK